MSVLALDVGGTYIKYACIQSATILSEVKKVPTPKDSQEAFLIAIEDIMKSIQEPVDGICISLPGTIDTESGYVMQGGSLAYNHRSPLKQILEKRTKHCVEIENDARCAALAECAYGNMKDIENGIVLTFGTGIGGCLIIDGKIYKGTHLFSGEVSALITKDFRAYGSGALWGTQGSIPNFVKHVCDVKGIAVTNGPEVFHLIKNQDETSCQLFQSYCDDLAVQLFNLQILLDPKRICIGGGVSANPLFIKGIQEAMERFYEMLPIPLPHLDLCVCRYHNDANLLGAYVHYQKQHARMNQKGDLS